MARRPNKTPDEVYDEACEQLAVAKKRGSRSITLGRNRRALLSIPDMTGLDTLEHLNLASTGIGELRGIEVLTNLKSLNISNTRISDIGALAQCANLEELWAGMTLVHDLKAIETLTALKKLWIGPMVKSLNSLVFLKKLQYLSIHGQRVSDLAPIKELINLEYLDVDATPGATMPAIGHMINLKSVTAPSLSNRDLNFLAGLPALERLNLTNGNIETVSGLEAFHTLRYLDLDKTMVRDVSPIGKLAGLRSLDLSRTEVRDLSSLASLTSLSDEALSSPWSGGFLAHQCKSLMPESLRTLQGKPNPTRTVESINILRLSQNLPAYSPAGYSTEVATSSLTPVDGVTACQSFAVSPTGKVTIAPADTSRPLFPFKTSRQDHSDRLEVSRMLADDLIADLDTNKFQARPDYKLGLRRYLSRLPGQPEIGNILLADAEIRTLRNLFAAEIDILSPGFSSKLKTLMEQHIGLRVYYPSISEFYKDVQSGKLAQALPMDAVDGVIESVKSSTPDVFDEEVQDSFSQNEPSVDRRMPSPNRDEDARNSAAAPLVPPKDPLGELEPSRAREYSLAGAVNNMWKAFLEGERVHKSVEAWIKARAALEPHLQVILEWLRSFMNSGGPPPVT